MVSSEKYTTTLYWLCLPYPFKSNLLNSHLLKAQFLIAYWQYVWKYQMFILISNWMSKYKCIPTFWEILNLNGIFPIILKLLWFMYKGKLYFIFRHIKTNKQYYIQLITTIKQFRTWLTHSTNIYLIPSEPGPLLDTRVTTEIKEKRQITLLSCSFHSSTVREKQTR